MLDTDQQKVANLTHGYYFVGAGAGAGKCLQKGTKVIKFNGEIVPVEDIVPGDQLLGPDGSPRNVLSTSKGEGELVRINPVKGDSWVCNRDHILSLRMSGKRQEKTYGKFVEKSIYEFEKMNEKFRLKSKLWRPECIPFDEQEVSIDPYFVGVWLGDGSSELDGVSITKPDPEIFDCVSKTAGEWGLFVRSSLNTSKCPTYSLTCGNRGGVYPGNRNPLLTEMRKVFPEGKRIPKNYLINDECTRLQVLAGLLDTDGYYNKGYYEIITKGDGLAEDILFCARSLGLAAYRTDKKVKWHDGRILEYNRISISGDVIRIPVRIPRKKADVRRQIKSVLRTGFTITKEEYGEYYGFVLDGDSLFLLGDFTVTHNTTVLLHRAANLSKLGSQLVVTFTREASKNLQERGGKLFPGMDTSVFSTLHSLGLRFAHEQAAAFPFELDDNPLAGEGVAAKAVFEATKNKINFQAFTTWVSLQKRNRIGPNEALSQAEKTGKNIDYAVAYKIYNKTLEKQGVLDYDDLIFHFVEILERRPDIRQKYQPDFCSVDEAQDCCSLDWRLLQLLTEKHKSLLCVGDGNQAVYGFRGGSSELFMNMEEYFPGTQKYYLGANYRSSRSIVKYSKKIAPYQELAEHFYAVSEDEGVEPTIQGYSADFMEASGVVDQIERLGADNCAVLARTNLALRATEEELIDRNIKYHILGDSGYWSQPEVLNVLAWVRCVVSPTDNALISALRSPFHPTKYVKKKIVADETKAEIQRTGETAWEILKRNPKCSDLISFVRNSFNYKHLPPTEVVAKVMQDLKAIDHYKEESSIVPDKDPIANLRELVRLAGKHESLYDFLNFVRKISGVAKSRKGVCLSTGHSSKGKEWDHVFVISCNLGVIPHVKAEDIEEEKRVYYVMISRPAKSLQVSFWGNPSPFLGDRA